MALIPSSLHLKKSVVSSNGPLGLMGFLNFTCLRMAISPLNVYEKVQRAVSQSRSVRLFKPIVSTCHTFQWALALALTPTLTIPASAHRARDGLHLRSEV